MYLVFETLSDSLFAWNHSWAFCSSLFVDDSRIFKSLLVFTKLLSSAKREENKDVAFGRSFIHICIAKTELDQGHYPVELHG